MRAAAKAMRIAHKIRQAQAKLTGCKPGEICFSLSLKWAWEIVKGGTETVELAELTGSSRQIAWARDIRDRMLERLGRHAWIVAPVLAESDSSVWIERRIQLSYIRVKASSLAAYYRHVADNDLSSSDLYTAIEGFVMFSMACNTGRTEELINKYKAAKKEGRI